MWRTILWQGLGLLCYLGGMIVFLVVGLDVYFAEPTGSLENMTTTHLSFFLVSLVLIVLGGGIMHKHGGGLGGMIGGFGGFGMSGGTSAADQAGPEKSRLEELGYVLPPEESDTPSVEAEPVEDNEVRCPSCGEINEAGYRFCGNCSAQLPS